MCKNSYVCCHDILVSLISYTHSNDIVRVVRFRELERSSEIMEESDHQHVDEVSI